MDGCRPLPTSQIVHLVVLLHAELVRIVVEVDHHLQNLGSKVRSLQLFIQLARLWLCQLKVQDVPSYKHQPLLKQQLRKHCQHEVRWRQSPMLLEVLQVREQLQSEHSYIAIVLGLRKQFEVSALSSDW